jgi:hypothetical protein
MSKLSQGDLHKLYSSGDDADIQKIMLRPKTNTNSDVASPSPSSSSSQKEETKPQAQTNTNSINSPHPDLLTSRIGEHKNILHLSMKRGKGFVCSSALRFSLTLLSCVLFCFSQSQRLEPAVFTKFSRSLCAS